MSAKSRKAATDWFINTVIAKLHKGNRNVGMYHKYFGDLKDNEFHSLMEKLASGEVILPYYSFNMDTEGGTMSVTDVLRVGDELGIDFFQQLYMVDPESGIEYLTPEKYLIVDIPVRRQAQHLTKKKDVPDNDQVSDVLSGQVAGPSKSAMMSLPEIMILESAGHHKAIEELIKTRGGDHKSYNASKRQMIETGGFTLKQLEELGSRPTSTDTVKAFLLAMHFDNNI